MTSIICIIEDDVRHVEALPLDADTARRRPRQGKDLKDVRCRFAMVSSASDRSVV